MDRSALSEGAAQCVAPRCLSAGGRPAGLVAVIHAAAASRSEQCRAWRACPLQTGQGIRNQDLSAALATAINDWQIAEWTSKDSRLKGSIVVANEDGPAAAAEIRKRAGDKNFVQVLLLSRNVEPLGQRRYWPIYQAAEEAGPADRRACVRLRRQSDHRVGLAELLHRGDGRPFAMPADRTGEHRAGGRVRAASETEDGHDRGRLRLGAVAVVAARQELAADAQRGAACEASAVGIYPRPHLLDHPADGRPGAARSSVRRDRLGRLGQAAVCDRLSALGF